MKHLLLSLALIVLPSGLQVDTSQVATLIYVGNYLKGVSGPTYRLGFDGGQSMYISEADAKALKGQKESSKWMM